VEFTQYHINTSKRIAAISLAKFWKQLIAS